MQRFLILAGALLWAGGVACDAASDSAADPTSSSDTAVATDASTTAAPDAGDAGAQPSDVGPADIQAPDAAWHDSGPAATTYPPPPYGVTKDAIFADHFFYDPWAGADIYVHDYFQSSDTKLLMIVGTTGWCNACLSEAIQRFAPRYEEFQARGLEVLYTLHEDASGLPMYPTEGMTLAHDKLLQDYRKKLGVDWPMLADKQFQLAGYFYQGGLPLVVLVDTATMEIRWVSVGHEAPAVNVYIDAFLD